MAKCPTVLLGLDELCLQLSVLLPAQTRLEDLDGLIGSRREELFDQGRITVVEEEILVSVMGR